MYLSLLFLLTLLPAHLIDPDAPGVQKLAAGISLENATYTVTIAQVEKLDDRPFSGNKKIHFVVHNKMDSTNTILVLESYIDIINDLYLFDEFMVLNSQDAYSHWDQLFIFNLHNGQKEIETFHNGMEISPSGRFLIYKTTTPRHGTHAELSSVLIIYDLKEKSRNKYHDIFHVKGWVLYPADATISEDEFCFRYYEKTSPFFWTEGEKELIFCTKEPTDPLVHSTRWWDLDHEGEEIGYESFVVRVNLFPGADSLSVHKSKIINETDNSQGN